MMKFDAYLAMGDKIDYVLRRNILKISRNGEHLDLYVNDEALDEAMSLVFEEFVEDDEDADLFYRAIEERKNILGSYAEKFFSPDEED